jgi:hypothetical protein
MAKPVVLLAPDTVSVMNVPWSSGYGPVVPPLLRTSTSSVLRV